jgi:hypothetical protein
MSSFKPAEEKEIAIVFDSMPGMGNQSHNLEIIFRLIKHGFKGKLRILYPDISRDKVTKLFSICLNTDLQIYHFKDFFGLEKSAAVSFIPFSYLHQNLDRLPKTNFAFTSTVKNIYPPALLASNFSVAIPPANFISGGARIANQSWLDEEELLEKNTNQSELEIPYFPDKENLLSFLRTRKQENLYKLIIHLTKENPFIIAPYFNGKDKYSAEAYTIALANIAAVASHATATKRKTVILSLYPVAEPKALEVILQGNLSEKYAAEAIKNIQKNINSTVNINVFTLEAFLTHTPQPNELAIVSLPFLPSSMFKIIAALSHLLIAEGANNVALRNALGLELLRFEYDIGEENFFKTLSLDNIFQHIRRASQSQEPITKRWESILATADALQDKDKISQTLDILKTRDFPISQCHAIELKDIAPGWRFLPNNIRNTLRIEEYGYRPKFSDIECRITEFKSSLSKLEPSEKKQQQQLLLALAERNINLARMILQQFPTLAVKLALQNLSVTTSSNPSLVGEINDLIGIAIANQDSELLQLLNEYGVKITTKDHKYFAMFTSYQFYQTRINVEHMPPPKNLAQISIKAKNYSFTRGLIYNHDRKAICAMLQDSLFLIDDADLAFDLKMDFNCKVDLSNFFHFISINPKAAALYKLVVKNYNLKPLPSLTICNQLNVATQLSEASNELTAIEFLNNIIQNCRFNPRHLLQSAQCITKVSPSQSMAQDIKNCLQTTEDIFLACPETGYVVQNTDITQNALKIESSSNINPIICEQLSPTKIFCKQIISSTISEETKCEVISDGIFTETRCIENINGDTHVSAMYYDEHTKQDNAWPAPTNDQEQPSHLCSITSGAASSAAIGFCQTAVGKIIEKGLNKAGASPSVSFWSRKAASAALGTLVQVAVAGWKISHLLPSVIKTATGEISAKACELAGLKLISNGARVAVPLLFDIVTDPASAVVNVISASIGAQLAETTINRFFS